MPLDLAPGVEVHVDVPAVPPVQAAPPRTDVAVMPVEGPPGPPGPAGPPGSGSGAGQVLVTATAATNLSGHRAVTMLPDGTLGYADNTTPGHVHAPIWVTLAATTAGDEVTALAYGTLAEPSWSWISGPLYLGANGFITQTPPTAAGALFLAQIGVATGATTAFIDRQASIRLT